MFAELIAEFRYIGALTRCKISRRKVAGCLILALVTAAFLVQARYY